MTTTMTTQQEGRSRPETIQDLIGKYKGHMAALMPKHVSVERLFRVAMLVVGRNPKLGECHPATLIGCILESTRLGLEPGAGAGETWLIPYKNNRKNRMECQLIIDYRGLIKLIKRANKEVEVVLAEKVCERDDFEYGIGESGPFLRWKPAKGDRGAPVAYVAAAWSKGKTLLGYHVKTADEVQAVRKRSRAAGDGPWITDFQAMALKTVLRPLGKYIPGETPELQRGIALDERASLALPQDLGTLADPTEKETPPEPPEGSVPEPQAASATAAATTTVPPAGEGAAAPEGSPFKSARFKVKRAAKTEAKRGNKTIPVIAVYAEGDGGAKYLCAHVDAFEAFQRAAKEGLWVDASYEETDSGIWIEEFKLASA